MMKIVIIATTLFVTLLLSSNTASAFAPSTVATSKRLTALNAYVPDGLTPEQYKKIKEKDQKKLGKDLGKLGPRGFKSRSMQAWQEAFERGETSHTFAPFGYKEKLNKGQMKKQDVPYMVRGGSWDNSDVKTAKKLKWTKADKEYAAGGYKKEQSASIIGSGPGLDWTGTQSRVEKLKKIVPGFN